MAELMKPAVAALLLSFLGAMPGAASLLPEDFRSVQLPNAGGTNQWFFFPDAQRNPRIVAKAIANTGSVNRVTLTGGPPKWTASPGVSTGGMNKEGVFVQKPDSEIGYLVGEHFTTPSYRLRMWSFTNGQVGNEVIDNVVNSSGMGGVSAALDLDGNLHASWIWNVGQSTESLAYGRRNSSGVWQIVDVPFAVPTQGAPDNGKRIGATAVVPSAFGAANVYFTLNTPGVATSLMRMNTLINASGLFLANPTVLVPQNVRHTLRGTRVNSTDRVYFFIGTSLRRWNGGGETQVQPAVTNAVPRSIHFAGNPADGGRQRIAWYDSNSKKIYYCKPDSSDTGYGDVLYSPVTLTGTAAQLATADLQGLHFNAAGLPFILYRRAAAEGYVAFPNDEYDMNGNGRAEIIDEALGSPRAVIESLPLGAAVSGVVLLPANRFKFRFPTANTTNIAGVKLESATKKLRIEVEVSPNATTWSKLTTPGSVAFTLTNATGGANPIQYYAAVLPEEAPGNLSKRFARLIVTRLPSAY